MKSYWIWNYGDYEIFHSNRVNARRQEFGVDYPAFWKYYDVDSKILRRNRNRNRWKYQTVFKR